MRLPPFYNFQRASLTCFGVKTIKNEVVRQAHHQFDNIPASLSGLSDRVAANVFQLCKEAVFGVQNCQYTTNVDAR